MAVNSDDILRLKLDELLIVFEQRKELLIQLSQALNAAGRDWSQGKYTVPKDLLKKLGIDFVEGKFVVSKLNSSASSDFLSIVDGNFLRQLQTQIAQEITHSVWTYQEVNEIRKADNLESSTDLLRFADELLKGQIHQKSADKIIEDLSGLPLSKNPEQELAKAQLKYEKYYADKIREKKENIVSLQALFPELNWSLLETIERSPLIWNKTEEADLKESLAVFKKFLQDKTVDFQTGIEKMNTHLFDLKQEPLNLDLSALKEVVTAYFKKYEKCQDLSKLAYRLDDLNKRNFKHLTTAYPTELRVVHEKLSILTAAMQIQSLISDQPLKLQETCVSLLKKLEECSKLYSKTRSELSHYRQLSIENKRSFQTKLEQNISDLSLPAIKALDQVMLLVPDSQQAQFSAEFLQTVDAELSALSLQITLLSDEMHDENNRIREVNDIVVQSELASKPRADNSMLSKVKIFSQDEIFAEDNKALLADRGQITRVLSSFKENWNTRKKELTQISLMTPKQKSASFFGSSSQGKKSSSERLDQKVEKILNEIENILNSDKPVREQIEELELFLQRDRLWMEITEDKPIQNQTEKPFRAHPSYEKTIKQELQLLKDSLHAICEQALAVEKDTVPKVSQ